MKPQGIPMLPVFKGWTSLSKWHKRVNRFSEDVDIAVIITPKTTGNQIKPKLVIRNEVN